MTELLRVDGYRRMPWKNGLGETAEIAIAPDGASVEAFDWRLSMARVGADGPFSAFVGIDRTLTVIEGAGMRLRVGARAPVVLAPGSAPCAFRGDEAAEATLVDGPITDLNVMSRRAAWRHAVRIVGSGESVASTAAVVALFCLDAALVVTAGDRETRLARHDTLLCRRGVPRLAVSASPRSRALLIEIEPA